AAGGISMRALTLSFALASTLCFLAACVHQEAKPAPAAVKSYSFEDAPAELVGYRDRAKGAFEAVGKRLIPRLTKALNEGVPVKALLVCRELAQRLTVGAGQEVRFAVGRSSRKLRNPVSAPRDWLKQLVEDSAGKKGSEVTPMVFGLGDH